ncbi:MAG: hydantoinase/oxoprolinase family protein [Alteromonadaceae bacterium]|nr:hydantoinase/oxoprolinase family protein [Alteromonadaceae bacterium]
MRIGIDVGGTHTDAVLLDNANILASVKAPTSKDVVTGVISALTNILQGQQVDTIDAVMIGTTQFTNAVVERRQLAEVAAIRIGLPSGVDIPPMTAWPDDIADAIGRHTYMIDGGFLYDGWPLAELNNQQIQGVIDDIKEKNITNVAIAAAFSPMNAQPEHAVAEAIKAQIPNVRITLSYQMGRLGILERENAAILNASLLPFADIVVSAFQNALKDQGLSCPMFISQNDGTLMNAKFVRQYPALTFASGPTNSLRGASQLTGLKNAIVVDIGGTTSDIGVLQEGFPRESNMVIEVGGVRTNFRMPDIQAVAMGGGSHISSDGNKIGPQSVGHQLLQKGLIFGGETLTATDIAVAHANLDIGDHAKVATLPSELVKRATDNMHELLDRHIDMMKPNSEPVPVILVGGGSVLISEDLKTASEIIRPENAAVANAIGAAIAQIGGEAEQFVSYREVSRDDAISMVTQKARQSAIEAGADANSLTVVDIEETAIPYMDDGNTRVRVKVIGEVAKLVKQEAN